MKITTLFLLFVLIVGLCNIDLLITNDQMRKDFYSLSAKDIKGESFSFDNLRRKKVLIVNTASDCGLTPQYENLQELHDLLGGEDFIILGFPSNDFGAQEPGTETEIQSFCHKNYGVTFKMMSKVSVKGMEISDVYNWLTNKELNGCGDFEVQWNFHKFLIDENGDLVKEVLPQALPIDESILAWIKG
jgi:glutathione peroxidase